MQIERNIYRNLPMFLLTLFSAVFSLVQLGGFMVFGLVPIVAIPILMFPICLLGWWRAEVAAVLAWVQIAAWLCLLIWINWPHVAFGLEGSDYALMFNAVVLTYVAIYDWRTREDASRATETD
jgi:hypothetical protein